LSQDVYDKAGIFTKQYLANEDLSKTVIVGSEAGGLFRSLYYLDNAKASLEIIQRGADYDLAKLPAGKEWILVIGDHEIKGAPFYQIPMNGFALIRPSGENVLDFKKGAWPGIIRKVKGLSTPELWGTWSQSDVVVFEFAGALPSEFEIQLVANAFGPNVDKEFMASVGNGATNFSLSANSEKKIIRLENPEGSNVLRFRIPNAVSPKALGLSGDDRNLGIGFVEMKIVSIK
jgi:phosphoglycerol transferase